MSKAAKTELEKSIEESINIILEKYLNKIELNIIIENVVNDSINNFLDTVNKNELEKLMKENIKTAVASNLSQIQLEFEKSVIEKTYEYTNGALFQKVKSVLAEK